MKNNKQQPKKLSLRKTAIQTRKRIGELLKTIPPSKFKSALRNLSSRLKKALKAHDNIEMVTCVESYMNMMLEIAESYKKRLEQKKIEDSYGSPLYILNTPPHGYTNYK